MLLELSGAYDALAGSSEDAYGGVSRTAMAMGKGAPEVDKNTAATSRWNAIAAANDAIVKSNGGNLEEYFAKLDKTSTATGSTTKTTDALTAAFDAQSTVVSKLKGDLDKQVEDLDRNTQAAKAYASTLATQLLGGIDLGAAQQTGADLGISTLEAFDQQIGQAEWFGNVLESIKGSGADQKLIDQLAALGPAAGGKLAQEMIDKGLVQTFSDRLVDVVTQAETTAQAMVPAFLTAGMDGAQQFVDGTLKKLDEEKERLKTIGKLMGKTIGAKAKAEILEAVAEAVAAAEASKSAAAAEKAATIAAQEVRMSEQQIAQAVQRLIVNSNARAGYNTGAPASSPVFG